MEAYSSIGLSTYQDDGSYYSTPAHGPEDIICPGSDTEETPKEIQQKRLRYEAQARRYLQGHRPVLLSTNLRGPFSKETGWINPWGHPRKIRKQNKIPARFDPQVSKSGCVNPADVLAWATEEDAMRGGHTRKVRKITQSKSLEKAPPPRLAYMNPAEVLAWQVRVGAVERLISREAPLNSDSLEESARGDDSMVRSTNGPDIPNVSGKAQSEVQPADSMINHYVQTPTVDEGTGFTIRSKRARDSEWLMGSYVSKRARWEGQALSSPTPVPNSITLKRGNIWLAPTGSAEQRGTINHRPPSTTNVPDPISEIPQQAAFVDEDVKVNPLFSRQVESQRIFHSDTIGTGFSSIGMISAAQLKARDQERDELQEVHQSPISSSRRSSGRRSRKSPKNAMDRSLSDLEEDHLVAITPHLDSSGLPSFVEGGLRRILSSGTLPKLPRSADNHPLEFDDDSFISDVAPSSRNLEQFHFKKRRRCTKSTEYDKSAVDDAPEIARDSTITEHPSVNTSPLRQVDFVGLEVEAGVGMLDDAEGHGVARDPENIRSPEDLEYLADGETQEHDTSPECSQHSEDERKEPQGEIPRSSTQGLKYSTTFSDQQSLPIPNEKSLSNNEVEESWNLGEMSFLRAVLRAADSGTNTPSTQQRLISKPKVSPLPGKQVEEGNVYVNYLPKLNFGASKHTPIRSQQNPSPAHLTSPGSMLSMEPDRESSQQSDPLPGSKHRLSQCHAPGSSQHAPSSLEPLVKGYKLPQGPQEHDSNYSGPSSISKNRISQLSATGSSPQAPPQIVSPSQKSLPSQDPNDVSTQSFNTMAIKSQRSLRPPQSERVNRLANMEAQGLSNSNQPNPDAEQDAMDLIQLELSQVFPSSSPQSTTPSELADNDFETTNKSAVEPSDILPLLKSDNRDTCEPSVGQIQKSPENLGDEPDVQTVLPRITEVRTEVEVLQNLPLVPSQKDSVKELDMNDIAKESNTNEPRGGISEDSEAGWEGCGPQSPWATEQIEPILVSAPTIKDPAGSLILSDPIDATTLVEHDVAQQLENSDISSEWQCLERPHTPEIGITPFKELMTPTESPKPKEPKSSEILTNTQLVIEAATNNPWMSNLKKRRSLKTSKRVSFSNLSSQPEEESQAIQVRFGPVSPPPPTDQIQDEDTFKNGTTGAPKFREHFNRQFRRILPENVTSPINSSPALAAQAEAFIAADRETSTEQDLSTIYKTPSRHLKPRREADSNTAWKQRDEAEMLLLSSRFGRSFSPPVNTSLAGFDMDEALGDAGNFLEDWSVEAELKKAKEPDTNRGDESASNGFRRRRLFGLV